MLSISSAIATSRYVLEIQKAREETDRLFSLLHPDALYHRPIDQRHRVIFYIGHLEAFDFIQICREGLGWRSRFPDLDSLFQAGIDPPPGQLPQDTPEDWPSLKEVRFYADEARKDVDDALAMAPEHSIAMAVEHRHMHAETLAYMWHNFEYSLKKAPEGKVENGAASDALFQNDWKDIPDGEATLGRARNGEFGWDNEFEEERVHVPRFRMQKHKVTNGEYLRFVKEGAPLPHFWAKSKGRLFYRGMFSLIPLPLGWPVYVTQREAEAYSKWIGKALPTEAQFHRAAYGTKGGQERQYPWGDQGGEQEPNHNLGNFGFRRWDPESVLATPRNESAFGIRQLVGNGWEWTSTVFAPLPGFRPHPAYAGYSANFFDGEHYVVKGGSPRTAQCLLRRSFRNWFRPEYPYVYAGFHCVEG